MTVIMETRTTLGYDIEKLNSMVAQHLRGGLHRYIANGTGTGHFLAAVLSNNLLQTFAHGSEESIKNIDAVLKFLYNYTDGECYGSPEKYKRWVAMGGHMGKMSHLRVEERYKELTSQIEDEHERQYFLRRNVRELLVRPVEPEQIEIRAQELMRVIKRDWEVLG